MDKWHFVNIVIRFFRQILKTNSSSNDKRSWKDFLCKSRHKLSVSEKENIDSYLDKQNQIVKNAYKILQTTYGISRCKIHSHFISQFNYLITQLVNLKNGSANTLKNLFLKWQDEIENFLHYNFTNGYLESANTKIKLAKRLSYGFKLYERFSKIFQLRITASCWITT